MFNSAWSKAAAFRLTLFRSLGLVACSILSALPVNAAENAPEGPAWDLPVWKALIDQASRFEGRDYYKLLNESGPEHKALRSTRGAVMALIETSDFYDPDPNGTLAERADDYDFRFEDLGKPSEATLRLVQQLTLENLAAEISVARALGEKLHFAERSVNEAFRDRRHPYKSSFTKEEGEELHHRCQNIARLSQFLELLPGGEDYPQGIERSNATLLLYYVVQGSRDLFEGVFYPTRVGPAKGVAYCNDELRNWPRIVIRDDRFSERSWNFQLPELKNLLETTPYDQIFEKHTFPFRYRTRKKGFGDEADRYQADTKCGRIELEGARTSSYRDTKWTYPFFDSHYRWVGPIAEGCRSPAGGHNYNTVHEVIKAWAARVEAP